jgi:hypothetical protein
MNSITEHGGDWRPNPGERILGCTNPWTDELRLRLQGYDHCGQCAEIPYRAVVIDSTRGGQRRGVALCGRHFVEACKECSQISECSLPGSKRLELIRTVQPDRPGVSM